MTSTGLSPTASALLGKCEVTFCMPGFVAATQKIHEPTRFNDGHVWKTWQAQLRGRLGRESGAQRRLCSAPINTRDTTREAAQILVAPNGAELRIRSQLYQQTGGIDWLPNLA